MKPKVYLIGAGPGDPGLITVKGLEILRAAEVVIYDYLAGEKLLEYAKAGAELIYVGKRHTEHVLEQEEINRLMIDKARQGKIVARLKGGDPFIFGRGGEEAEALAAAGISFEVIPGVTSATAVPAYAGIPLTHRNYASSVAFITGHKGKGKEDEGINWQQVAAAADTLVFFMGVTNLPHIVNKLKEHGRSPQTPAALIRWGTYPTQETLVGTLEDIVEKAKKARFKPPAIVVVGEVVKLRRQLNWFEQKPLFGKRVVVTRPQEQAGELSRALEHYGAEVIEIPAVKTVPPSSWETLDRALEKISDFQGIIFTSQNAVEYLVARLWALGRDLRDLKGLKIIAVGPATAGVLKDLGLRVDLVPKDFRAEGVIAALKEKKVKGQKFLFPRAKKGREIIPQKLEKLGAKVEVVEAYQTLPCKEKAKELKELLAAGKVDVITFASPSAVNSIMEMVGGVGADPRVCPSKKGEHMGSPLQKIVLASIGPVTSKAIKEWGLRVAVEAKESTAEALAAAAAGYFVKKLGKEC
jgi:uroporphyrinogen III methyltransferase/synthase